MSTTTVPTFRDADGRDWPIVLTVGKCRAVKEHCGIELHKLWANEHGLAGLITDPVLFAEILWCLCETKADAISVSPTEFGDALDSESLELAFSAFTEAIVLFTPPAMRQAVRKAIETEQEAQTRSGEALANWVDSDKVKQAIDKKIQQAVTAADATLTGGS